MKVLNVIQQKLKLYIITWPSLSLPSIIVKKLGKDMA